MEWARRPGNYPALGFELRGPGVVELHQDALVRLVNESPRPFPAVREPKVLNHALRITWIDAAGVEHGPVDDEAVAHHLRIEHQHEDDALDHVPLAPGAALEREVDLLRWGWMLPAGRYEVIVEYPLYRMRAGPVSLVLETAPWIIAAHGTWEYDRGAEGEGVCAWSTSDSDRPGVYLRVHARNAPGATISNRRLVPDIPPGAVHASRASTFEAALRHVWWRTAGAPPRVQIVTARDARAVEGRAEVDGAGLLDVCTCPWGRAVVVRSLERDGARSVRAEWLRPDGGVIHAGDVLAIPAPVVPPPGQPDGAVAAPRFAALVDATGVLWVAAAGVGALRLGGLHVDGAGKATTRPALERALPPGDVAWLEVATRVEGTDIVPEVRALIRGADDVATLVRARRDGAVVEPLVTARLPGAERVIDGVLDRQGRLFLLRAGEGDRLSVARLPAPPAKDAPPPAPGAPPEEALVSTFGPRFRPEWSGLVLTSELDGYRVHVRGVDGGRFVHEVARFPGDPPGPDPDHIDPDDVIEDVSDVEDDVDDEVAVDGAGA